MRIAAFCFAAFCFTAAFASAQSESIGNAEVMRMARAGLSTGVIAKKIEVSECRFDLSANALVELRSAGVPNEVIEIMLERPCTAPLDRQEARDEQNPAVSAFSRPDAPVPAKPARPTTVSLVKSSLQPSRQALEKELMKRKDFLDLKLSILRYKDQADLYVEIGFVSGSWITHRYVYRIYDRRTGTVLAAGETTSWGSLAKNLARHISKGLARAVSKEDSN